MIPDESVLTRSIKFQGRDYLLGNQYNQPVIVRSEQGFTYAPPNSGFFNLNPASTMKTQNAIVDGYIILEQSGITYEAVARSDNVNSFRNAVDLVMQDAMESFSRRLEIGLIYGQSASGLGKIATATAVGGGNTTDVVITFAPGEWSAGLWTPLEGAAVDVYNSTGTWVNTGGGVQSTTPTTVKSIDVVNKTITLSSGLPADVTAIAGVGANGFIRFAQGGTNGASEAVGLNKIFTNTGMLFGIDASAYSLWKANVFAAGGALTLQKLQQAVAVAAQRGLNEDVEVFVNPSTWQELATEAVAYRMMDSSYNYKEAENGFETLCFYSQNGKLSVIAHKYVKEGEAYLFPTDLAVRIGSSDISFNIPGTDNGQIFIQNPTQAGFNFRIFSQQNLLVVKPAHCVLINGIT